MRRWEHWVRVLPLVAAGAMLFFYGLLALATLHRYLETRSLNVFGLLVVNTTFLVMYAARRDTTEVSRMTTTWALAFSGTFLPLLMRPTGSGPMSGVGDALQLFGFAAILAALWSLRRSFGIVPAHRGIRTTGMYRVVRHPLYAAELLTLAGVALAHPSVRNASLWIVELAVQLGRTRAEEAFLGRDPDYAHYVARVRYRLLPGIL